MKKREQKKLVLCPHPKCDGEAAFDITLGGTDWYVCQRCRFQFPDIDTMASNRKEEE